MYYICMYYVAVECLLFIPAVSVGRWNILCSSKFLFDALDKLQPFVHCKVGVKHHYMDICIILYVCVYIRTSVTYILAHYHLT